MGSVLSRICRNTCVHIPVFVLLSLPAMPGLCQTSNVLTIGDAVKEALANNRLLNAGALDIGRSSYAADAARTAELPVFHINATGGGLLNPLDVSIPAGTLGLVNGDPFPIHNSQIYSAGGGIAWFGASITQPLTELPGIELNVRLQKLGVQLSSAQQQGRRTDLAVEVKKTYYEILEAQDSLDGAQKTLDSDHELEKTVSDFVTQKTALAADLMDAQAQSAQQQLKVVQLQDELADGKEKLNDLLGRDLESPFEVAAPDTTDFSVDNLAALRTFALSHRSDIREAQIRLQQTELGKRLAHEPNVPIVSAVLSYNRLAGGDGISGLPNQLSVIGLQLDWKPFDWGKRSDDAGGQDLQYHQAQAALLEAEANAALQVDSAVRQYKEAIQEHSVAQLGQQAAEERLREMTNQYNVKAILLKDLLQQQAAASDAADKEQLVTVQMLAARTELEAALGDDE